MRQEQEFYEKMRKIADINNVGALLSWDQETYMPPSGADARSRQSATISHIAQELLLDPELEKSAKQVLEKCEPESDAYTNAKITLEDLRKSKNITSEFAADYAKSLSLSMQAWQKAKSQDDFNLFAPHLEKMISLSIQKAKMIDANKPVYDVLLDEHEPGLTSEGVDCIFEELKKLIIPLYNRIRAAQAVDDSLFTQKYPHDKQASGMRQITSDIGFDYERGRADLVEHPFCVNFSSDDVRIASRIKENDLAFGLWASIHEAGHALYEQGLPREQYGLPLGSPVSSGVHESQSRLWEKNIGHSREFVSHYFPYLQLQFPEQLANHTIEEFYRALNAVKPWPIRTEADELTYHLHIIIRYEMERGLISGEITVSDAPNVWREKYKDYLGLDITTDSEGILQDVHWSCGYIGYFPTYTIGSLYGAQYAAAAKEAIPEFDEKIQCGDFKDLLSWLRENIHSHGRRYSSEELCKRATGKGLDTQIFADYITAKMTQIYNLKD